MSPPAGRALVPVAGGAAGHTHFDITTGQPSLAELADRAAAYGRRARSPATERAYRTDWADFSEWCRCRGLAALPALPTSVGLYLADRANTHRVATLRRRLVTIKTAHRLSGEQFDPRHPAIVDVFAGIRRTHGTQEEPRAPLITDRLRDVLRKLPRTLAGARDRALLLIGFAGAFRASELVALNLEDITHTRQGVRISVRRSKTDQEGTGEAVAILRTRKLTCPVAALEAWLRLAGITEGAIFRTVTKGGELGGRFSGRRGIALLVKRLVARAGIDAEFYSSHSMRSGFCTTASDGGADIAKIAQHARHKSLQTTKRYIRDAELFRNPALSAVDL